MKVIITVIGEDKVGIIAAITQVLAAHNVNILSINQTILNGIYNMVMFCESKGEVETLHVVQRELREIEAKLGVEITAQHADIFYSMHQID